MATTTARSIARRASAMPAFDYAALAERGQTRHGRIDAADPDTARSQLERRRLLPGRVAPARGRTPPAPTQAMRSTLHRPRKDVVRGTSVHVSVSCRGTSA